MAHIYEHGGNKAQIQPQSTQETKCHKPQLQPIPDQQVKSNDTPMVNNTTDCTLQTMPKVSCLPADSLITVQTPKSLTLITEQHLKNSAAPRKVCQQYPETDKNKFSKLIKLASQNIPLLNFLNLLHRAILYFILFLTLPVRRDNHPKGFFKHNSA